MLRPDVAPFAPEDLAREFDVSRETLARLKLYIGLVRDWNARHNLVSARSLEDVWRRHILDSAQLLRFLPPSAKTLVDLGAGAGFPGLVLALLKQDTLSITLIEATAKKARFLAEAATRTGANVRVLQSRIEDTPRVEFDVVTARACAPLDRLLGYAQRFVGSGSVCLFLKGQNVGVELTEARNSWRMDVRRHPSISDPSGTILEIRLAPHERRTG